MKLLEFPEEVKSLCLENCHIMNHYIDAWINTTLGLEINTSQINISSNVLKSLISLLDLSVEQHRSGYLKFDFKKRSGIVSFRVLSERVKVRLESGVRLQFDFTPMYFSTNAAIIPNKVFDKIKSIDLSEYTLPYYYFKIDFKDLDLSRWNTSTINISSDDLMRELGSIWTQQRSYEELFPALHIVTLIHESLRELKDSRALLDFSMSHHFPNYPMLSLTWSLKMIPDTWASSFKKGLISHNCDLDVKNFFRYLRIYIPYFVLTLNIS